MSLENYLKQNIKADALKKASEFKNSSSYQAIKTYVSSDKFQAAKMSLKNRDKSVHKTILADIERLQNKLSTQLNLDKDSNTKKLAGKYRHKIDKNKISIEKIKELSMIKAIEEKY